MYERRTTFCQTSLLPCRSILRCVSPAPPRASLPQRFLVVFPHPNVLARLWPRRFFYFSRFQSTQTGFKIPPAEKSECHPLSLSFSFIPIQLPASLSLSISLPPSSSPFFSLLLFLLLLLSLLLPDCTVLSAVNPRSSHRPAFRRSPSFVLSVLSCPLFLQVFDIVSQGMNEECRVPLCIFVCAILKSCSKLKELTSRASRKIALSPSPK